MGDEGKDGIKEKEWGVRIGRKRERRKGREGGEG